MDEFNSIEERKQKQEDFYKNDWFKERPDQVKAAFKKYPPFHTYRLKETNQIVFLYSLDEDRNGNVKTCKVNILAMCNPHKFMIDDRRVFDVKLENLEDLGFTEPWEKNE